MPRDLLLEIGTEEMPASFIEPALEDLKAAFIAQCAQVRLSHLDIRLLATPRRLAMIVDSVADSTPDLAQEVRGPPVSVAFDSDGRPTQAGVRFAQRFDLSPDALGRVSTPKGDYVLAHTCEDGQPAGDVLRGVLRSAIDGIRLEKSMRWGDVSQVFVRPVRWIVALHGDDVVPVVFGDVQSGRQTLGHRFLSTGPITLQRARDYESTLERAHVIPDLAKRREETLACACEAAGRGGGSLLDDAGLLDQVVNLVEWPIALLGSFDPQHLDLPHEVLIQEMKGHQRYFSVVGVDGKLMPQFVAISNTPVRDENLSLSGYERVLRARLADARFFFDQDRKISLTDRIDELKRVVWHGKIGSYYEKVQRIRRLVAMLVRATGHDGLEATVERAAMLCKADLVSEMVGEFPELQGIMGREYALASGEAPAVAWAISEHYMPRQAHDAQPTGDSGAIVGLADRFDTLCCMFAIGKRPKTGLDPFALRRTCLAIISVTTARPYRYSLREVLRKGLRLLPDHVVAGKRKFSAAVTLSELEEFFFARLKAHYRSAYRTDIVEAVLDGGFDDLATVDMRLQALSELVDRVDFSAIAVVFKRVVSIAEKEGQKVSEGDPNPAQFTDKAESHLYEASQSAKGRFYERLRRDDFAGALKELISLERPVDAFFNDVLVMAEDPSVRENRLRLLAQVSKMFRAVANFALIQTENS